MHRVEELLGRAHTLFSGPASGAGPAWDGGGRLTDAVNQLRNARRQMDGQHGALPARHDAVTAQTGRALDAAAAADTRLGRWVRTAACTDEAGRSRSRAAVDGVRTDVAALTPMSQTPAGQRALIAALRARIAQQHRAITACKARDAQLAALLRTLGYTTPDGKLGRTTLRSSVSGDARTGSAGGHHAAAMPAAAAGRSVKLAGSADVAVVPGMPTAAPGPSVGTPLGALTPDSSPREVASAIIHEAHRRGYSPDQTKAILADALQESNLNPQAQSPNKLWYSIFQQDSSYPGRHNPNLAIAEFFNRLDHHGGAASRDIWKSIFWLQQRPGEPSAQAAFAHGRQAYLREIQSQAHRADALYRAIVSGR